MDLIRIKRLNYLYKSNNSKNISIQPVLNGYIYPKQLMKITFSKLIGNPKIEALILVKGSDY